MVRSWLRRLVSRKARSVPRSRLLGSQSRGRIWFSPLLERLEDRLAPAGGLDPTFGIGGKAVVSVAGWDTTSISSIAQQPDGKIVAVGSVFDTARPFGWVAIFHYDLNGSLDATFGTDGHVISDLQLTNSQDHPDEVVLQPDGKILFTVKGSIVRFNADGTRDSTGFDPIPGSFYSQLALQSDSKIVVAGSVSEGTSSYALLARYDADGVLDTTFGSGGIVKSNAGFNPTDVGLQADGKILVATSKLAILRYAATGQLDPTFGTDGIANNFVLQSGQASNIEIEIRPDGRIMQLGSGINGLDPVRMIRWNPDGTPDLSFGTDGQLITVAPSVYDFACQAVGKVVTIGSLSAGLSRYNSDGSLDPLFGGTGTVPIGGRYSAKADLLIQDDGRILIGRSNILARYLNIAGPGNLQFGAAAYSVNEVDGKATISVVRADGDEGTVAVHYATTGGTARAGIDYTPVAGTLEFGPFVFTQTITIPLLDAGPGDNRTVTLRLDSPPGGAGLGTQTTTTLNIVQPTFFDTTFGTGGWVTTDFFGPGSSRARAVAVQPDGKLLFTSDLGQIRLFRTTADGQPDATFGSDGVALTSLLAESTKSIPERILVQEDGKLIVAAIQEGWNGSTLVMERFSADGSVDTSFGDLGLVTVSPYFYHTAYYFPGNYGQAATVAQQPDGKLVVAGPEDGLTSLRRFTTTGTPDSTFGTDGKATLPSFWYSSVTTAVVVQPDGKLLVAGTTGGAYHDTGRTGNLALARMNADGTPDTTFGTNGIVFTPDFDSEGSEVASGLILQPDGKIVIAGSSYFMSIYQPVLRSVGALARYTPDGVLDPTFGSGGRTTVSFDPSARSFIDSLVLQDDGKFVVAGKFQKGSADIWIRRYTDPGDSFAFLATPAHFAAARLNADGSLDPRYGREGVVTYGFPVSNADAYAALALQPDGKVVVTTTISSDTTAGGTDALLFRLLPVSSVGSFQLSSNAFAALDSARSATITVTRTFGADTTVTIHYATSAGSAIAGTDYTDVSGTLTFAAGVTSQTFTIPLLRDLNRRDDCTVKVTLSNPSGEAALGTPSTGLLTIVHDLNADPGQFQLSAASYAADEDSGSVAITVTRTDGLAGGVAVQFATQDGTAQAGTHYVAMRGFLVFGSGETSKTFTIPLIDDSTLGPDRTLTVALSRPGASARLGSPISAVVTLLENDGAVRLQFALATVTVNESDDNATLTVTRTGGAAAGVTVHYATADGSARAGTHFTAVAGDLTFAPGEISQTFTIPLLDDSVVGGDVSLHVVLSFPGGGAMLGSPSAAVVSVQDDDQAGQLQFAEPRVTVNEKEGVATLTVTRTGGAAAGVTVHYATADDTAVAGTHYTRVGGVLSFAAHEISKAVSIPILDDAVVAGDVSLLVSLSHPGAGATLGSPASAVVVRHEDDQPGQLQFASGALTVSANEGSATLAVLRGGGTAGSVTVHYATADGTALADTHYTAASGDLTFAPDETSKTISLTLHAATLAEGERTFSLTLSNAGGGATLGTPDTVTVTLLDPVPPTTSLAPPANLTELAWQMTHSAEAYRFLLEQAYQTFVDRPPTEEELTSYWLPNLLGGAYFTDEQVEALFLGAPEYLAKNGGSDEAWLTSMYGDLLFRQPSVDEIAYWIARLAQLRIEQPASDAHVQVALEFDTSAERTGYRVQGNYERYLGRQADADEVNYWVDQFRNQGQTSEVLAARFVGSFEYFNNGRKGHGDVSTWVQMAYLDILHRPAQSDEIAYWLSR